MPRRDAERLQGGDAAAARCARHRVAGVCLLVALAGASAGAASATLGSPPGPGPRSQPFDLDYRVEGSTSLVLQVFDDGEAVHVQPAPGARLALASPGGLSRTRGPYLVLPRLADRFVLVDSSDPSRRVEITHRRRVVEGPSGPGGAESPGMPEPSAGIQPPARGAGHAGLPRAPSTAVASADNPEMAGEPAPPSAVGMPADAGAPAGIPAPGHPLAPTRQGTGGARLIDDPPARTLAGPEAPPLRGVAAGPGAAPDTKGSPPAGPEPVAPPLVFVARASVQATLRSWLAAQGMVVEFVGVPALRVEEDARVQARDIRSTVGEALARLGLRGEWIDRRLRVVPDRGTW